MKRFCLLIVALSCAALVFSVPLQVSWSEGTIMVRFGSSWKPLDTGSLLDSSSLIQLAPDSLVELTYSGGKLVLSAEGTYQLDMILANAAKQQKERSTVLAKVGKLVTNQAPRSSTVAGVRGSEQVPSAHLDWIIEEETGLSGSGAEAEAYALLQDGDFLQAAAAFSKLSYSATADKQQEYHYSQAWCLASANDLVGALKLLRSMGSSGVFAVPRSLLLARLSLDTMAVNEAVQILEKIRLSPELQRDDRILVQNMLQEAASLQTQKR